MTSKISGSIGILDVGSNSIRLVVYEPPYIGEKPVFNEKVQCSLGADLSDTGKLYPAGKICALEALSGFKSIAHALDVKGLHVIGTAALRDASDGVEFAAHVKAETGIEIEIINGETEARYAALGVLINMPDAKGIIGDMGGGSLELAKIADGAVALPMSLPLGALRIMAHDDKHTPTNSPPLCPIDSLNNSTPDTPIDSQANPTTSPSTFDYVKSNINDIPDTFNHEKVFYAVGGTWRTIGALHQFRQAQKSKAIDGYEANAQDIIALARDISQKSGETLIEHYHVEHKRAELLPYSALMLVEILEKLGSKTVAFTSTSVREGKLVELLNKN